ncbi:HEAT repeat domain-containing protein [Pirellulimonas nuda]|uniref:HEAT repeat domain-containing protein n=1 Tax=Pirellulimonas nuda TaxID=2528009 RepID=UPI0011A30DD4|nr:HEAT repeat domain-containing protein [Pirellulimonas nuda]
MSSLPHGLERTLRVLASTKNGAAADVLDAGLRSPQEDIAGGAAMALLRRRDPASRERLVRGYSGLRRSVRPVLHTPEAVRRIRSDLSRFILGDDQSLTRDACRMAVDATDLELLPPIAEAAAGGGRLYAPLLAAAALRLATELGLLDVAANPATQRSGVDPAFLRRAAYLKLAEAADSFPQHGRLELVEALLHVSTPRDEAARRIISTPSHPCHAPLIDSLRQTRAVQGIDIVIDLWLDAAAPTAVRRVAIERGDRAFVGRLLSYVGAEPGPRVLEALTRDAAQFRWLTKPDVQLLCSLTGEQQAAAAALAYAGRLQPGTLRELLHGLLKYGSVNGRVAACRGLVRLPSGASHEPLILALADDAPAVVAQAAAVAKACRLPDAEARLVSLLDHPAERVRHAAQSELTGLRFDLYRDLYPRLTPQLREAAGRLVAKADPRAIEQVEACLRQPAVNPRLLALEWVEAMGIQRQCAPALIALLHVSDTGVQAEAARLLGGSDRPDAARALAELADASSSVLRDAVRASLKQLCAIDVTQALIESLLEDDLP